MTKSPGSSTDLDTRVHFMIQSSFGMPGGNMEANVNTPKLADVIKQFQEIRVDDYPRTYSWRNDQIDELFEDPKEIYLLG
jgi:hypothetical protein